MHIFHHSFGYGPDIFFVLFFHAPVCCACMHVCMFTGMLTRLRSCKYGDQGLALDVLLYLLRQAMNTECTDLVILAGIPVSVC